MLWTYGAFHVGKQVAEGLGLDARYDYPLEIVRQTKFTRRFSCESTMKISRRQGWTTLPTARSFIRNVSREIMTAQPFHVVHLFFVVVCIMTLGFMARHSSGYAY